MGTEIEQVVKFLVFQVVDQEHETIAKDVLSTILKTIEERERLLNDYDSGVESEESGSLIGKPKMETFIKKSLTLSKHKETLLAARIRQMDLRYRNVEDVRREIMDEIIGEGPEDDFQDAVEGRCDVFPRNQNLFFRSNFVDSDSLGFDLESENETFTFVLIMIFGMVYGVVIIGIFVGNLKRLI
ncbi:hypothetical protein L596_006876 [Steinernema carpocapsae]|uniref:Uncharacterized protein n=1 Tax=Steinernema carpocapsae TaxID=34508 RepID=A0A4U5P861_STECR|nr:hypothetical protein L596_006876 [Steinernema carpocapsae]